ncbi:uncharacterized protein GIQ15_02306 [Arthroderma uncinatum]|uniref:uncharacterized protein n=1 Tax=Arthroderma uncinatum TaxID=74035 RepID=UPI00144A9B57|nr:uncharacterized protein GIQ15_02306 [Arthroderma uncinatum]KAF3482982.1 hypothetical protein GIQ15_02306 [Arthroderma uncinatum]
MKISSLLLVAASAVAATKVFDEITTILPSDRPTVTIDPWQCVTHNLTKFFEVPTPTGALLAAISSHGSELIKDCVLTIKSTERCLFPESSDWCRLSTAAPKSLLPALSSYGSVASVWWSSHSSAAFSLAEVCPVAWYDAMLSIPGGWVWLNETRIYAGCYAESQATAGSGHMGRQTATPRLGVTDMMPPMTTATPNNVADRDISASSWIMAGARIAASLVTSLL